MPYVKMDANLLESSLWLESIRTGAHDAIVVWQWLLLRASADGVVETTIPAIAHGTGTTTERAEEILEALQAEDPHSRTPTLGGRRIVVEREPEFHVVLVNFDKYRAKDHTAAERQRRHRERKKVTAVTRDVTQGRRQKANSKRTTAVEEDEREETETRAREAILGADGTLRDIATGEDLGLPGVEPPPKAGQDRATKIAEAYLRTFNSAFGRRVAAVSVQRAIVGRVKARLKDGIEGALLVALPILARAEGSGDYLARDPLILLRDGTHAKTRDGQTSGATDHALGFAGRLDQIELPGRLTEAAKAAGVANWLHHQGVTMKNPAPEPPPESRDVHSSASQEAPRPRAARGRTGGD